MSQMSDMSMSARSKRKWSPGGPLPTDLSMADESPAKKRNASGGNDAKNTSVGDSGRESDRKVDKDMEGKLSAAIAAILKPANLMEITMKQVLDALAPEFGAPFLKQHKKTVIRLIGEQYRMAAANANAPAGIGAAHAAAAVGSAPAAVGAAASASGASLPRAVRWDSDAATKRQIRELAERLPPTIEDRISRAIIESKFIVIGDYVEFSVPSCLVCRGQVVKLEKGGLVHFRQTEDMYSKRGRLYSVRRPDGRSFPDEDLIGSGPASALARFPHGTVPIPLPRPANAKPWLLADGLKVIKATEGDEYRYACSLTLTFEDQSTLKIGAATWYNTKNVTRDKPDNKEHDFQYLQRLISQGLLRFRKFSVHDDEGERESDPFLGVDFENGLEITASGDPEGNFSGQMTVQKGERESLVIERDCD